MPWSSDAQNWGFPVAGDLGVRREAKRRAALDECGARVDSHHHPEEFKAVSRPAALPPHSIGSAVRLDPLQLLDSFTLKTALAGLRVSRFGGKSILNGKC